MNTNRRLFLASAVTAPLLASDAILAADAAAKSNCLDAKQMEQWERLRTDWPWLARYREENAALLASQTQVDVVFMGDSITEGWSQKIPALFSQGRVNRGISGQTTPQMLVRFRADVIELKPRVVHIMAGTNDIAGNTGPSTPEMMQANLMSMVEVAQAHKIAVILASIPPASRFPWRPGLETAEKIAAMNAWLKGYAAGRGIVHADYYAAMATESGGMKPGLANDEVHPTAQGYEVMNPIAETAIREALKERL
jgi:lysophospholipase L1-like esterase